MSLFDTWATKMGFNLRQKSKAADAIGASHNTISRRDLSKTELLAMSAARAGLSPWSEDYDQKLVKVRSILDAALGPIEPDNPPS